MNERSQEIENQINAYKQLLEQSDYKALKHADGVISDEGYQEVKEERQFYRDEINRLREELARITEETSTAS